jgi:hypothetical protein
LFGAAALLWLGCLLNPYSDEKFMHEEVNTEQRKAVSPVTSVFESQKPQ